MNRQKEKAILEAILFTMGESVEIERLATVIEKDRKYTKELLLEMKEEFEGKECGITLMELEESFQMCTKAEMYEYLIKIAKTPRKYVLTDTLLNTLSIVAYKQPVTKLEIEKIRGVKSDHAVNRLVEYNLVQEVGRLDAPGRPALFATTEEFLRRFGIGSREELPDMDPVRAEEIRSEVEEELNIHMENEEST